MSKQALHIGQENLKACLPRAAQISSVLSDMVDYVEVCPSPVDVYPAFGDLALLNAIFC